METTPETVVCSTPSTRLQDLTKDPVGIQDQMNQLVSQNTGLEEEKQRILTALRAERTIRKNVQKDCKNKEQEKNDEILLLKESLKKEKNISLSAKVHLKRVVGLWKEEREKNKEIPLLKESLKAQKNISISAEFDFHRALGLWKQEQEKNKEEKKNKNATIKTLAEDNVRLCHVVQEKDALIKKMSEEKMALERKTLEDEAEHMDKQRQMIQREAEFQTKLTALEEEMAQELAAKQSLEKQYEMEKERREKEWIHQGNLMDQEIQLLKEKVSALQMQSHRDMETLSRRMEKCQTKEKQMENTINLLTAQNAELQVHLVRLQDLAQKTDKEKACMRKEQEKAQKAAEDRLKKERKEEEKRANKQKEENKKQEKEELKRQKREKEEMEKRVKKERKEQEKREKEGLKIQKKERERVRVTEEQQNEVRED
ncbi:calponin homology domain-containing protein DDB_G0272472-like [Etheostoma spectabile]|uniref:calponin homology domain-containing protein DDB_G0272472-like n=1 Tax=Etheostoma spectabile TaxID=54343 RepID=UPI0013AF60EC|nr:calponin homology domain-containing protein DDB_G0272472-like [Etheostoma spectabile]